MSNFKMATPPHIKKVLKKLKSEYKSLVTTQQDRFKSSEFNAGVLRVSVIK